MEVVRLEIPDVIVVTPRRFGDQRGHFAETYNARRMAEAGVDSVFIQDNQSLSRDIGTLRGLHCQVAPHIQGKLVRVLKGAIWDVAIDARTGSPSYGKWVAATLTAERGEQLWVPPGFLHGFCTLEAHTEVFYKVSGDYDPASERGVIWNDPTLALPWPLNGVEPSLSEKDKKLPGFDACHGVVSPMSARIVVVGQNGQLATALRDLAPQFAESGMDLIAIGRPEFDFDRPESIETGLGETAPALVINAAAWTAVDAAESDPEGAARANDTGPARIAKFCAGADIPFIHVSTDYVFDGLKGEPYDEADPTCPTGVYGATKRDGEEKILASGARAVILRTSWVYSPDGKNFVRTMLGASLKRPDLKVVADQRGCPTTAGDLADAIFGVAGTVVEGWRPEFGGVFHAAGTGWTTWHGLAVATFESAARYGNPVPTVAPIATADWPTPATRPPDSRLSCARLAAIFGRQLPDWRGSLDRTIDQIFA